MTDLLVKLYTLPAVPEIDLEIRRALAPERHLVIDWIRENFSEGWASEAAVAFGGSPIRCMIAIREKKLLGFACFNTTFQGFFGPFGVAADSRGTGIGSALLIRTLHEMRTEGFAYAIIGATKSEDFYMRTISAIPIPDSWPGAYRGMLP